MALGRHTAQLPRWARHLRALSGLSIRRGPTKPPLVASTIPEHFASVVARFPDNPALIVRHPPLARLPDTTLTFAALDAASNRLAWSLSSLGVRKADRVAVSLGNTLEFAALTLALAKLGAILVPLNPTLQPGQVASALTHVGAETLVVGAVTDLAYKPSRGRSNAPLLQALPSLLNGDVPLRNLVVVDNRSAHDPAITAGFEPTAAAASSFGGRSGGGAAVVPYAQLAAGPDRPVPAPALDPADTANIQFTSGTTASPKAAMLSHFSTLNNALCTAHEMGMCATDRVVIPPPLFHCFGLVTGLGCTSAIGAAALFAAPAFDPHATLAMCADHAATGLYGVNTMFTAMFGALDGPDPPPVPRHLVKGIAAGSVVPPALAAAISERLGVQDLLIAYGMTETSPVSCMTRPGDPLHQRTQSVGTPMPHTAVKIVSRGSGEEDRRVLPLGERGELAVQGYLVMQGYWGDAARTAESLVAEAGDGAVWMYSGDEAEMDADGFVRVTGRIKDTIIRAGENIHPLEVEVCVAEMPGVRDVAVVGVPDDRLGEAVAAFVIRAPNHNNNINNNNNNNNNNNINDDDTGKEEVRAHVRERLAAHLVPKYVFWVDDFPKTASGKIQRFQLRDDVKHRLAEGL